MPFFGILYNKSMTDKEQLQLRFPFYQQMSIEGERSAKADEILCSAINRLQKAADDPLRLCDWVSGVRYYFENIPQRGLTSKGWVKLNPNGMTEWTVLHELAHAWDAAHDWQISKGMSKATHSGFFSKRLHRLFPTNPRFWYRVGMPPAPCGIDKNFNEKEDFAEAVTAYLFPDDAHKKASKRNASYEFNGFIHFHDTPRGRYIRKLFGK